MPGGWPSAKTRAMSSAVMPRAASLAPGLQKQPVRTEIRRAAAAASTSLKSTTAPSRSSTLNGIVTPRSSVSRGPYRRSSGDPSGCRMAAIPCNSRRVSHWTRRWITGIPIASTYRNPIPMPGRPR